MEDQIAILQHAISLREIGEVSESIRLLRDLERKSLSDEQRAVVLTNLATSFATQKQFDNARHEAESALKLLPAEDPLKPYALLVYAGIMYEQGEVQAAKAIFEQLLADKLLSEEEHRELWVDALGRLACSLVLLADYRAALPKLREALRLSIDPSRTQVLHLNLGIASESMGDEVTAQQEYEAAASGPDPLIRADAHFRLGRTGAAR